MQTILGGLRMGKSLHRVQQSRRSGYFKDISNRTLNLMEDIVKADIDYDEKHGICYGDGAGPCDEDGNRIESA